MFRFLQNYPHVLEIIYDAFERALQPLRRWLMPDSRFSSPLTWVEKAGKSAVFDCQMCGQCILHSTGMTCSMTCPKNLRNGPCGGVRTNGRCEIKPEMQCVWVVAFERSQRMSIYGHEMLTTQPPLNWRLAGTSSWINMLHGIDSQVPNGWVCATEIVILSPETQVEEK